MRKSKNWLLISACIATCTTPFVANAQHANGSVPPPPKLEKLDEGEVPAITIRKPGDERSVSQKRAPGGKVTEIKVVSGNSTYYLKPNDPAGSAATGDAESDPLRAAQWQVLEFDSMHSAENSRMTAAEQVPSPPVLPVSSSPVQK